MRAIHCSVCGQFEAVDKIDLQRYNMSDGDLTFLACGACVEMLSQIYDQSQASMIHVIRALRVVLMEADDEPVVTSIRVLRAFQHEKELTDRRLRLVVLEGGLGKPDR